jgi:DNA-binding MarR family transcriptional regulator
MTQRAASQEGGRDPVEAAARHWAERYPGFPPAGFRALTSLVRTYGVVLRSVEALLGPLGLTLSRYEVLLLLSFTRTGSVPIMRLRDLLMIHGSSVTYLVDRLEESGWVVRELDPADRRVSLVVLTKEGRDVVDRASAMLVEGRFGVLGALEESRADLLSDLLAELRQEAEARAAAS